MKAFSQTLGIALTGLLLTAGPALAQGDRGGAAGAGAGGDRGGSTTSSGGGASAGTGGGGNIVSSSGGGGGGSVSSSGGGGGGDFSSPSASSFSSPSISMGDRGFRSSAPEHRVNHSQTSARQTATGSGERAAPRAASDGSSASSGSPASGGRANEAGGARERAVSRGTGTGSREGGGSRRASESTNNVNGVNEVPNWSRPRGNRPATDVAVTRTGPRPPRDSGDRNNPDRYYGPGYGNDYYPYYPYDPYYGYGYGYGSGYGYACGFYCGYYGYPLSLYGFGYGIPSGYFDPFFGNPDEYGEGYGGYSSRVYGSQDQGSLKLKVKPRNAKVYVDGYYVGVVDEFDGAFQKLTLNGGRHKVELRAEGYETTEFDVLVTPEHTVTFAGDMKKVQ